MLPNILVWGCSLGATFSHDLLNDFTRTVFIVLVFYELRRVANRIFNVHGSCGLEMGEVCLANRVLKGRIIESAHGVYGGFVSFL